VTCDRRRCHAPIGPVPPARRPARHRS
jgi:hypothetical protein